MKQNFTIVTALFNIQRENWTSFQRPFEDYLNYSKQLLHMNVPLLAFVDRSVEEFVRYHRRNKEHLTQIIVSSIHELEYYDDYNIIKEIMDSDEFRDGHAFLNHPEGFSPEYNILMNSKFPMLYEASKLNYFNSTHFYWLDMGYGHNADIYPNQCDWAPKNLMYNTTVGDKITYIQLNPVKWLSNIYEIYKKPVPPFLNGGFFGGSAKAVERYYNVHKEMFKLVLLHRMVDDDQTMAILSVFKERELFNLVDGWWYDAFKLFH